jgi:hypothetical protein
LTLDLLIPFGILFFLVVYLIYSRVKFEKNIVKLYEDKLEEWKKHSKSDEKIETKKDYPTQLSEIFLEKDYDLKFKQVFNCFARRFGGDYYSDPLRQQGQPLNDYYQRFVNLKLLNIEMDLVKEKFLVEDKIAKLDKAKSIIEEYQEALDTTNNRRRNSRNYWRKQCQLIHKQIFIAIK